MNEDLIGNTPPRQKFPMYLYPNRQRLLAHNILKEDLEILTNDDVIPELGKILTPATSKL